MKKKKECISIVVPVYKSEDCLEALAARVDSVLKNYELILVNDCSPDKSWAVIRNLAAGNRKIKALSLMKNAGQDNALMAGLSVASGEYVVIMDDDLQHDPVDIPRLLANLGEDFDVCYANFMVKKQKLWKNLGSWLNGKVAQLLIKKPKGIYLSPFKIMRRHLVREILKYTGPYPYVDGLIFRSTSRITQVDVEHNDRFSGKGNYNLVRSIRVFLRLATNFSVMPLRVATMIGMLSFIVAFVLAIMFLLEYFIYGIDVEGWISQMLFTLFLGGVLLMCVGMMGEYIGRLYMSVSNAPQYSLRECINLE